MIGDLRRSRRSRSCVILITALAFAAPGYGATPQGPRIVRVPIVEAAAIRFQHVSLEPATVRGIINRIVQDDRGFIWFATNHGVLRYDGHQFRAFVPDPEDPNSIRGTNVLALSKDGSGRLWVGSDQNVDRYDPVLGVFHHVLPDGGSACAPAGIVRDIAHDRHGFTWVSTDNGLIRLDPSTSNTTCHQHRQDDDSSLSSSLIKTTLESRDGRFWVITSVGLDELDRTTSRVTRHVILRGPSGVPLTLEGNKITMFEDHAGVLWITIPAGQGTGLASFDAGSGVQSAYLFGDGPVETAFSMLEDEDRTLWFGMWQQGLVGFNRDRNRAVRYYNHPRDRTSLSSGTVISLFQDRERRIWAGFDPPVVDSFFPRHSPFQIYRHDPGDPDNLNNAVVSVLEDSRGTRWVGRLSGLDEIDQRTGRVTRHVNRRVSGRPLFRTVHAIAEDRAGNLWFGEWGNGLNRLDPRTGRVRFYNHNPDDPTSLSSNIVESLYVDRRGTLWVGTYDALDRFDPATGRFRAYRSAVPGSHQYRAITEDPSGALWLASLGSGLHRFDPATGQFSVYRRNANDPRSLSNDIVNTVYVDRSGVVWAGTSDGLCGLDQNAGTFTCYHSGDGLPSSVVEGILGGERGDLWLSTSDGLSRFTPRTRTFRNFYADDGLPSNEFRFGAASRSSTGELFFGSTSGLLAFFPERVIDDPSPPPVVLTDFWLLGNRVRPGQDPLRISAPYLQSLTLGPQHNIFSLEFAALSYSNPRRTRYQYRLEGLEEQWNERDSSQRLVTYTTLPPGEYVFRVKATNSLGVSSNATGVRIRILPPWWSTRSFQVACLVVFLAVLWGLYRLRIKSLQRQERQLREVIETLPALAFSTAPDGTTRWVNRRWVEYSGLSADATSGSGWRSTIHPDDVEEHVNRWQTSLANGEPFENEARHRSASGEYRWFLVRAVPRRDEQGAIVMWYGTLTDIEDRKKVEQERERVRQLQAELAHVTRVTTMGELAASISHELKQPMSAARINAHACLRWLRRENPDVTEACEAASSIVGEVTRAAEIIDRLRSLYRKGTLPARELVDVNDIAREMLVLLRNEANRYSVSMRTDLASVLPRVTADRVQLQQVCLNLMLNAIEAMKDNGGELTIKSALDQDGDVLISVSDTGVGLPVEHADQIFNAFFTTKPEGSGMGLAVSRSIIESHGGRLWASANLDRGATVQFTLPNRVTASSPSAA
jgi:PAS domain S-box-containing protein